MTLIRLAFRFVQPLRRVLLCSLASAALAGATASAAWADPPVRAARVADVAGTAWLFDPETKAWVRVLRNQSVGQGDQLRTDERSRVTLRLGSSTVWLDEQSDMEVLQLDDTALALRLITGDVALRLRTAQAAQETRVQTREGVISPEVEGLLRVDQLDRGSRLAVLQGRAQFDSDPGVPVQRAWLRQGEQAEFWWGDSPRIERQPISRDKFSAWFLAQDQAESGLSSGDEAYVSPEMTGAEDLNQNGNWEVAAEYGNVWIPTRVAAGWEPYRDGRWVWTRQWGWSWVDNAPWGFAPFHYGRWIQHRGLWAWAPGRFESRPAYSPALVAWVGGPQVSVGITIGGHRTPPRTGWTPLPPRQTYVPAYPHSPQYTERFRWDKAGSGVNHNDHGDRNDRNDRNQTPQPRGDSGPQPYRPAQQPVVSNPAVNTPAVPWYRTDNANRNRNTNNYPQNERRDGERDNQRDGQRQRDAVRQGPQQQFPAPVVTQNPNFVPAPAQFPAQPPIQPQQQPSQQQQRNVPIFNNGGGNWAAQPQPPQQQPVQQQQRQPNPPQPTLQPVAPPAQRAPQGPQVLPGQQGPQQAKPVDEEQSNGKRNKRDFADRNNR